jgi:type III secretion protein T
MNEFISIPEFLVELMGLMKVSFGLMALYMIRFLAAMNVLPATGDQIINGTSRTGIALMLAFFLATGQPSNALEGVSGGQIGLIAIKEMLIGVALGFAMSIAVWVVEFAGALIDNAAGYNSVQLNDPLNGQQSTPVSNMLSRLAIAVFFALGGMVYFAQTMYESYEVWPLLKLGPSFQKTAEAFFIQQFDSLFISTVKLAAPFLLVLLLIDIGIGLLTRSAEKLEPSSLAQPIKGVVTIVMLTMFVSMAFDQLRHYLVPRDIVAKFKDFSAPPKQ